MSSIVVDPSRVLDKAKHLDLWYREGSPTLKRACQEPYDLPKTFLVDQEPSTIRYGSVVFSLEDGRPLQPILFVPLAKKPTSAEEIKAIYRAHPTLLAYAQGDSFECRVCRLD